MSDDNISYIIFTYSGKSNISIRKSGYPFLYFVIFVNQLNCSRWQGATVAGSTNKGRYRTRIWCICIRVTLAQVG